MIHSIGHFYITLEYIVLYYYNDYNDIIYYYNNYSNYYKNYSS